MPYLALGRRRICYRDRGKGLPALLLVHGAGASSLCFAELVNRLGRKRRVVAVDLPAHGNSVPHRLAARPAQLLSAYRDAVAELAERLGLGRFVLIGHSMGGAVAQLFAQRYADRLAALVLLGTGARLRVGPQVFRVLEHRARDVAAFFAASAYSPATSVAQAARWAAAHVQTSTEVLVADFRACDGFDERERLGQLDVATTIIGGADDVLTPPALQHELAGLIPRAELALLPRAGHAVFQERADEVARLVEKAAAQATRP
jgi:pimeloyl-ACP methyl ester carboxylesterase